MADIAISAPVQPLPLSVEQRIGYGWGDYGQRGSAVRARLSKARVKCEHCGGIFSATGLPRHTYTCLRKSGQDVQRKDSHPLRHDVCACGRIKARLSVQCFLCGEKDEVVFACLNLLIRAKIETAREKLEKDGVPVDNPRLLALWIMGLRSGQECS